MAENPRIEELRRRVQADPASIAFAALAEEFRRGGRYDDAIQTCRTGLVRHPAYLSARVTLGRALIETGQYDAARVELETVLRSAPENIAARRGLEEIKERQGSSTEMAPEVAALANQPIAAAPARAPEPVRAAKPPAPAAEPPPAPTFDLSDLDLPLVDLPLAAPQTVQPAAATTPADPTGSLDPLKDDSLELFAAALDKHVAAPEPPVLTLAPAPQESSLHVVEIPPEILETPQQAVEAQPQVVEAQLEIVETQLEIVEAQPEIVQALPEIVDAPQHAVETTPVVFEAATIAFVSPVVLSGLGAEPEPDPGPDPALAATLQRLEQFLGAIQTARHA